MNPNPLIEAFLSFLRRNRIAAVFCVPGAQIEPLLLGLAQEPDLTLVVAAHEQGAAAMADGYARASGRPGVVLTINGPGILNTVTVVNTARLDHSPLLLISGDAPLRARGDYAFQASNPQFSDTLGILEKAGGWAVDIQNLDSFAQALDRFRARISSNPGPLVVNLPVDVALAAPRGPLALPEEPEPPHQHAMPDEFPACDVPGIILSSECTSQPTLDAVLELARLRRIPVAVSQPAKAWLHRIDPELSLGVYGYAGQERAVSALHDPAMTSLLVVGLRWDERNTLGWRLDSRKSIALGCETPPHRQFRSVGPATPEAVHRLDRAWGSRLSASLARREYLRTLWMQVPLSTPLQEPRPDSGLTCTEVIRQLNARLEADCLLFVDSGDHRIYAATYFEVSRNRRLITAARTGPMGWALGAAIGASFSGKNPIWVVTGDGCMIMGGNELAVAARYRRPVKVIVFENGAYGRIALRLKGKPAGIVEAISRLPVVDWVAYGKSLGVAAWTAATAGELDEAITRATRSEGPALILAKTPMEAPPCRDSIVSTSSEAWIRSQECKEPE